MVSEDGRYVNLYMLEEETATDDVEEDEVDDSPFDKVQENSKEMMLD